MADENDLKETLELLKMIQNKNLTIGEIVEKYMYQAEILNFINENTELIKEALQNSFCSLMEINKQIQN